MLRDLRADLWSNVQSTPVFVEQSRRLREGALNGSLTLEAGAHTLKFGGDMRIGSIREEFRVAESSQLPEVELEFLDEDRSTDFGLFLQDLWRYGSFSAALGLRFDHHQLLTGESSWSPRVGLSYWVSQADILFRASYDRVFQPPPAENLLFSSAAPGLNLEKVEGGVAVPASRGYFLEAGFRKPVMDVFRIDVSHYRRFFRNYLDDDVFLNTGLSFPITFQSARIHGTEVRLEMPYWKGVSGFASYSNMIGRATSPVTGGLFVKGGEAEELREMGQTFAISQDQRNTVSAQVRAQPGQRLWASIGISYGSGLPVELEEEELEEGSPGEQADSTQPIPEEILARVNFERGRLRSVFTLDLSLGLRIWEQEDRFLSLQFDLQNATDRLNVINFSGVFSGTALGAGRQFSLSTKLRF